MIPAVAGIPTNASAPARPAAEEVAGKPTPTSAGAAGAAEADSAAVVSISPQGASQATVASKSNKPELAYEAADTDKDGRISAYEQQSYAFRHPDLGISKTTDPVNIEADDQK